MTDKSYSPDFLADVERTLSQARLTRYMAAAGNDIGLALDLYEKNVAVSEALFGFLHGLEVAVRNSLHLTMSAELGQADWYRDGLSLPWPPHQLIFTVPMNRMITDARSKISPQAPIGKLVAELMFGFWPSLVANHFTDLWDPCLHKAFPHAKVPRRIIHWRLEVIRRLRNRIAHHEPILTSRNQVYTGFKDQPHIALRDILQAVAWISPAAAERMEEKSRYRQAAAILAELSNSGITL